MLLASHSAHVRSTNLWRMRLYFERRRSLKVSAEACLWNRMGTPLFDGVSYDGVNGNWDTRIDSFDDGDVKELAPSASDGGTGLADKVLLVNVSVNVCCLRYPDSSLRRCLLSRSDDDFPRSNSRHYLASYIWGLSTDSSDSSPVHSAMCG